jgi:hypothetical protein
MAPRRKRGSPIASTPKSANAILEEAELIRMALSLRLKGHSYRQIAVALKAKGVEVSYSTIRRYVMFALEESISDATEQANALRDMELARLDDLMRQINSRYLNTQQNPVTPQVHLAALDRVIRIIDMRAKLLGLHAPTRTDLTSGGAPIGIASVDTVAGLGKALADRERNTQGGSGGQ